MTLEKEIKKITPEECPNCKEQVLLYEKAVEKKIEDKTYKFCSEDCAVAYKETKRTFEDEVGIKEGDRIFLPAARPY